MIDGPSIRRRSNSASSKSHKSFSPDVAEQRHSQLACTRLCHNRWPDQSHALLNRPRIESDLLLSGQSVLIVGRRSKTQARSRECRPGIPAHSSSPSGYAGKKGYARIAALQPFACAATANCGECRLNNNTRERQTSDGASVPFQMEALLNKNASRCDNKRPETGSARRTFRQSSTVSGCLYPIGS